MSDEAKAEKAAKVAETTRNAAKAAERDGPQDPRPDPGAQARDPLALLRPRPSRRDAWVTTWFGG